MLLLVMFLLLLNINAKENNYINLKGAHKCPMHVTSH